MDNITINIAKEFTDTPGPRYIKEGEFSGELFRESRLKPQLAKARESGVKLIIDLDGAEGFGTSFLEEAFGGLIREGFISESELKEVLILISREDESLKEDIIDYIDNAKIKP